MGHIGNGGTGGMGYRGMGPMGHGGMGYKGYGQYDTGGMGYMGNEAHWGYGYRGMGHMGTGGMGYKGYGPCGQWDTGVWAMGPMGDLLPKSQKDVKLSKRCQVVKKMSSCQKDVKCQKMKHLDYGGGSQKN